MLEKLFDILTNTHAPASASRLGNGMSKVVSLPQINDGTEPQLHLGDNDYFDALISPSLTLGSDFYTSSDN